MQITLNHEEILVAIEGYVRERIAISDTQKILIDMKAGRGDNGFSATLEIVAQGSTATAPTQSTQEHEEAPVAAAVPAARKPQAVKPAGIFGATPKADPEPTAKPSIASHIAARVAEDQEQADESGPEDTGPIEVADAEGADADADEPEAVDPKPVVRKSIFSKAS